VKPVLIAIAYYEGWCHITTSILIVEDDAEQRALFVLACTTAGYRVATAPDGTAALALAEREAFDILLADLYLPGSDGDLVIREIKHRQPRIKTVLMSCHQDVLEAGQQCLADQIYDKGDIHQLMSWLLEFATPQSLHLQ
jgi:CheY-like chemotaxis protein